MTAEIAIMNKEAIALAADSAVTILGGDRQKIFTSANKLFALSKRHPVGIMIYGSAIFMGVPWETIIKIYRKKLGDKSFQTLEGYSRNFISFLDNVNQLFPEKVQEDYLRQSIYGYFGFLKNEINSNAQEVFNKKGKIESSDIELIIDNVLNEQHEKWKNSTGIIEEEQAKRVSSKYKKEIDKAIKNVFERLPLTKKKLDQLRKIAGWLFTKFPEDIGPNNISGIVVAGFGEKDHYPSVKSFIVEGIVCDKLKYKENKTTKIDHRQNASVMPFAQSEMVATFMEGVDPSYGEVEIGFLSELFNDYCEMVTDKVKHSSNQEKEKFRGNLQKISEALLNEHQKKLNGYRRTQYIDPVISVVAILPKDELAAMAESLVNLTSFKRKVSMESETVGGPIDVAVISKGDGFVWIKRKHYFEPELNAQFFANQYGKV